jgi:signal transduction histidine kinase
VQTPSRGLVLVFLASLLAVAWSAYGPFLVSSGPYHWSVTPANATLAFAFGFLWVCVTAITYRRDPAGRMWKLMLLESIVGGTWVLGYIQTDLTWTMAEFFGPLGAAILVHLVLAFPTGRLRDRVDRTLIGLVYFIVLPLQFVNYLFFDPGWVDCAPTDWCPANVLLLVRNDDLVFLLGRVGLLSPILAGIAIVEVIRHWRAASPVGRRVLAPVAFGMPLVFAVLGIWWLAPALDRDDIRVFLLQNKIFDVPSFLTPALFLLGILRTQFARGNIAALAVELGRGIPLGGLRDSLARTLRDPTLELAFAAPSGIGLVDPAGRPFEPPGDGSGRAITRLERDDGELLGILVHDPALEREDRGLVPAVATVARLALENERLAAQVRAQLDEVRASRLRIVEAGDAERRRVERDLHDGAQQRLVALTMRLEAARTSVDGASELIDKTTEELRAAISEVRDLARGLHPTILTEAGLRAAIEALAERTPIPVEIDVPDQRFNPSVEAAAYFVVAEALTNVVRYAAATLAGVRASVAAESLIVEIRDDGSGGADPARGTGLRGLEDRLASIGGTLAVISEPGEGTTVIATMPAG